METVFEILSILLVILAATGLIAMISILVTLVIIKEGGYLTLGYDETDDEIINDNDNEEQI